jgi:hypothetical protein
MTHLDILLPFSLPPAGFSSDLRRELNAPALAALTTRVRTASHESFDAHARALPHEVWLAREFGLDTASHDSDSPPVGAELVRTFGHEPADGHWFILHPVHIHIGRDHMLLTDRRELGLDEQSSRILFDLAKPLFEECDKTLVYGDANTWFLRADDWAGLQTTTPDAASGHNVDVRMPRGPGEREWRKLQSEVPMHWFDQPVNQAREADGLRPVNALWLWGGGRAASRPAAPYDTVLGLHDWMRALDPQTTRGQAIPDVATLLAARPARALVVLDSLLESGLAGDWARWLENMRTIEREWLAPLLASQRSGGLGELTLIATGDARLTRFYTTRFSLHKFWVKPSLTALLP